MPSAGSHARRSRCYLGVEPSRSASAGCVYRHQATPHPASPVDHWNMIDVGCLNPTSQQRIGQPEHMFVTHRKVWPDERSTTLFFLVASDASVSRTHRSGNTTSARARRVRVPASLRQGQRYRQRDHRRLLLRGRLYHVRCDYAPNGGESPCVSRQTRNTPSATRPAATSATIG